MFDMARRERAEPERYDRAVLSEIQMVLEFVAGKPDDTVAAVSVADPNHPNDPAKKLGLPELAARLDAIELALDAHKRLDATQKTLLLSMRDAVNSIVRPASGLTIAYTALVLRSSRGRFDKARVALAHRAFPGVVRKAVWHRWSHYVLLGIAAWLTFSAVWESTRVALGHSLIAYRSGLRVEQTAIIAEKMRLEASLAQADAPLLDKTAIGGLRVLSRLCDRPALLSQLAQRRLPPNRMESLLNTADLLSINPPIVRAAPTDLPALFESAEEQDVCDRDGLLALRFRTSTDRLHDYVSDWPGMVGQPFVTVEHLLRLPAIVADYVFERHAETACLTAAKTASERPQANSGSDPRHDDDLEYSITPVLQVTANYILPVIFAMLGASVFVIRDFYSKACSNRLAPGDAMLSWVRLMLGLVVGACVGLFFSSGQMESDLPAGSLVAALTLSASGLAFIAGYSLEGVFSLLNAIVNRAFDPEGRKA